jgi:MarR family transcriptional regulator, organic hydroperoxide resistance regulator
VARQKRTGQADEDRPHRRGLTRSGRTAVQLVDEDANRLFFRFFQASNTLQTKATQALDEHGITSTQWSVLGALSRPEASEGMSVSELSQYLLVSRQNLAGVLNRLEERRLVERREGATDRRERVVRMTEEGASLWVALAEPINVFYARALAGLTDTERAAFVRTITRIQRNMAGG